MNNFLIHISVVLVPLVFSNICHMLVVKLKVFSALAVPIWQHGFGSNKTWRGILFLPLINGIFLLLMNFLFSLNIMHPFLLGITLGLTYVLFELPNSFIKRKIGIRPGEEPAKHKILFMIADKTDSAFGVTLIYFMLGYINWKFAILLFIVNSFTHFALSKLLVELKLKSSF